MMLLFSFLLFFTGARLHFCFLDKGNLLRITLSGLILNTVDLHFIEKD